MKILIQLHIYIQRYSISNKPSEPDKDTRMQKFSASEIRCGEILRWIRQYFFNKRVFKVPTIIQAQNAEMKAEEAHNVLITKEME